MAFLDSSTAVIDAILTKRGRELLARNDGSFQITKFAFGDDEINYQLFNIANTVNPEADIINLPVLEPTSNDEVALLNRLVTLPRGTLKVATLSLDPNQATVDFGSDITVSVVTENGSDPQGYTATIRDSTIGILTAARAIPAAGGLATFTIRTGENASGGTGTTIMDIIGINTGARKEFSFTVNEATTT